VRDRVELSLSEGAEVTKAVLTGALFCCTECLKVKPASEFGLRKAGKVIRNQPQCSGCRAEQVEVRRAG
jgi:hypothetical protein